MDVHPTIATQLMAHIGERNSGLVFPTSTGRPMNHSNVRNRMLYPVLEQLGFEKAGFHAFRRFRITYLRQQGVQESLIKAWAGHSSEAGKESVTDLYDRTELDVKYRKEQAEQAGIGFTIPANVHIVQRARKLEVSVAA